MIGQRYPWGDIIKNSGLLYRFPSTAPLPQSSKAAGYNIVFSESFFTKMIEDPLTHYENTALPASP
jgi:hypothetical protein